MTIIQLEALENGQHQLQSQNGREECWEEGYITVPPELEAEAWNCLGWCDLELKDGVLVGITPTEQPEIKLPEPEPTMAERNRADIDFIAAMTGVTL